MPGSTHILLLYGCTYGSYTHVLLDPSLFHFSHTHVLRYLSAQMTNSNSQNPLSVHRLFRDIDFWIVKICTRHKLQWVSCLFSSEWKWRQREKKGVKRMDGETDRQAAGSQSGSETWSTHWWFSRRYLAVTRNIESSIHCTQQSLNSESTIHVDQRRLKKMKSCISSLCLHLRPHTCQA